MSSHYPAEGFFQGAITDPNGHTIPTPQTFFPTSEFRNKVIEILSRTANGCLQELGYRPGMVHQITELQNRENAFQVENGRLFADNRRLAQMIKDTREKHIMAERDHLATINTLQRQIQSLQKENQDILIRESSLAAGNPDYARLQTDYMRLQGFCLQLRDQVTTLQKFLKENPPLQSPQVMISNQQTTVVTGGQSVIPKQPSAEEFLQAHQQQQRFIGTGHDGSQLGQQLQTQSVFHSQSHSQTSIPIIPGPSGPKNRSEGHLIATSSTQTLSQANQVLLNHKAAGKPNVQQVVAPRVGTREMADPSVSRSSSNPSRHPHNVDAQGFRLPGYKPVPHGWPPNNATGSPIATTSPHQVNLPRRQVSAPSTLSGGNHKATPSPMNTPTSVPVADGATTRLPQHSMSKHSMNIPFVNPAIGTNVVPIGPPGKFLPPLAASVVKPRSPPTPSSRPPSTQTHLPSAKVSKPPPSIVDLTNSSPVEPPTPTCTPLLHLQSQFPPPIEVTENLQTPNLTPASSRASAAPSEDAPETTTPLDTPISPTIGLVGSPEAIIMEDAGQGFNKEMVTSLKRGSVHVTDDIDEGGMSGAEVIRKKRRLSEEREVSPKLGDSTTAGPTEEAGFSSTNTSKTIVTQVPGEVSEEDEEIEEEEEIEPDGTRSVKYCLEAFTDDGDDGVPTCLLCLSRFRSGLIKAPATLPPDMPLEERVQHFLDEHPTSWDDFRFARNG